MIFLICYFEYDFLKSKISFLYPYFLGKIKQKPFIIEGAFWGLWQLATGGWLACKSLNYVDHF
jgi:hypothetical protein